ncbi:ANTAR domain-containing protein [Microbulbifer sp. OS29]|uniref:ANTAR domain-containing protein n=1 Tax=Microbulbifer okhotskensis TaxID=2926617 RepID=A0A9X2EU80_9GAMM|nr:ANTAR domain-containing protein [Microbulbifer okhotskensis]MCO1335916.1 ANTAR domain-containing protein [Microbulbifer okhotskensis]
MTNRSPGIMLVDDHPERAHLVCERLRAAGYTILAQINSAEGLLFQVEKYRPDIVLIDIESPDRDILESLAIVNREAPTPVAMFSSSGNADFISRAVDSGVSAYMAEGITPERVAPAIKIAMAQFKNFQQLRQTLERTKQQLSERKTIERAKGLLMAKKNLSEDDAHKTLRNLAMNGNSTIHSVAEKIIHYFQIEH